MTTQPPENLKELVTQLAAANADGDEALRSELLKRLMDDTKGYERTSVYRETIPMYAVADEFGLATEAVESAVDQLGDLAQCDPALKELHGRAEAAHRLMCDVLDKIDELTHAAGEAMGLPSECLWA